MFNDYMYFGFLLVMDPFRPAVYYYYFLKEKKKTNLARFL